MDRFSKKQVVVGIALISYLEFGAELPLPSQKAVLDNLRRLEQLRRKEK